MGSLAAQLRELDDDAQAAFLDSLTPQQLAVVNAELAEGTAGDPDWKLEPHQVPPDDDWRGWLLTGGRGGGKSMSLSAWAIEHLQGPPCDKRVPGGHRMIAIAPTQGDAVSSLAEGPSSICVLWPGTVLKTRPEGRIIACPTGANVRLVGAHDPDDVERLRAAGNTCSAILEEVASWRQEESFDQLLFGLRLGPLPRWVAATTPKNRPLFKRLLRDEADHVYRFTIDQNPHLEPGVRAALHRKYDGTRLGRQELSGELLEDVEGALWEWAWIEAARERELSAELLRVAVGVDPSGSTHGDRTGIVAVGEDTDRVLWVLEDVSMNGTPEQRFAAAVRLAVKWHAGTFVVETAYGGDNIMAGIRQAWKDYGGGAIEPRYVTAKTEGGKMGRAEPVAALYEKQYNIPTERRIRHLPGLTDLEDQQTQWEPDAGWSPDNMDAMVHAARHLAGKMDRFTVVPLPDDLDRRLARRRISPLDRLKIG